MGPKSKPKSANKPSVMAKSKPQPAKSTAVKKPTLNIKPKLSQMSTAPTKIAKNKVGPEAPLKPKPSIQFADDEQFGTGKPQEQKMVSDKVRKNKRSTLEKLRGITMFNKVKTGIGKLMNRNSGRMMAFGLPEDDPNYKENPEDIGDDSKKRVTIQLDHRERLKLKKEAKEHEDKEIEAAATAELADSETRKKKYYIEKLKEIAVQADVFASQHTIPKHQVCIWVATIMIPLSILTITWDLLAAEVFEIPHLSTVDAPSFILFINFVAMPLAMYGYMMEYLMREHSRIAIVGLLCLIVHPILFLIRAALEWKYDGFRNEMKLYFEENTTGQAFEYPIGTLDPSTPITRSPSKFRNFAVQNCVDYGVMFIILSVSYVVQYVH